MGRLSKLDSLKYEMLTRTATDLDPEFAHDQWMAIKGSCISYKEKMKLLEEIIAEMGGSSNLSSLEVPKKTPKIRKLERKRAPRKEITSLVDDLTPTGQKSPPKQKQSLDDKLLELETSFHSLVSQIFKILRNPE